MPSNSKLDLVLPARVLQVGVLRVSTISFGSRIISCRESINTVSYLEPSESVLAVKYFSLFRVANLKILLLIVLVFF